MRALAIVATEELDPSLWPDVAVAQSDEYNTARKCSLSAEGGIDWTRNVVCFARAVSARKFTQR